jgi:hypothetical protein
MKRALYTVQRTVYVLIICSLLLVIKPVLRAIYYPTAYRIHSESYLSSAALALIKEKCEQAKGVSVATLIVQLKETLPWIEHVQVDMHFGDRALVRIKAHVPVCMLNEQHLLLSNGLLIDAALYMPSMYKVLPHLHVHPEECALHAPHIAHFITESLTPEVLERCALKWQSANSIEYKAAALDFTVLAHDKQCVNEALLEQCRKAVELFKEKNKNKRIRGSDLVADIRFAQQIIIRMKERGSNEGRTH